MSLRKILSQVMLGLAVLITILLPAGLSAENGVPNPAKKASGLESVSSVEVVRRMGLGWNLGNTMECSGDYIKGTEVRNFETAWGNPETTKEMIDQVKAAGFKSVRIPVAWSNLMGADYTIDPRLLERVKQIVDYVLEDGMIAMVNIHWDGGWWSKFPKEYDKSMYRYTKMWSQIAGYFRNYPCTLVFESLNEEGCFNDVWNRYGSGTPEQKEKAFGILFNINQAFVNLVRKSGGFNAKRHLLIAGYSTDVDLTTDPAFQMPKDPENHCIVSIHYYTPATFCILEKDASWGKVRKTWGTSEDLDELDANLAKIKTRFLDNGIPVIIGEYGAAQKDKDPGSVRLFLLTVAEKCYRMGMCPMLWDAGGLLDRKIPEFRDPELMKGYRKILSMKRD
jgi:endoglucanase